LRKRLSSSKIARAGANDFLRAVVAGADSVCSNPLPPSIQTGAANRTVVSELQAMGQGTTFLPFPLTAPVWETAGGRTGGVSLFLVLEPGNEELQSW
jgi:hypothetical protein